MKTIKSKKIKYAATTDRYTRESSSGQSEKGVSLIAQLVKSPPAIQETPVQFLGCEDSLEKRYDIHSNILGLPLWLSW